MGLVAEEVQRLQRSWRHIAFDECDLGGIESSDHPVHERLALVDRRVVDQGERDLDGTGGYGPPAERRGDVEAVAGVANVDVAAVQPWHREVERLDGAVGGAGTVRITVEAAVRVDGKVAVQDPGTVDVELVDRRRNGLAGVVGRVVRRELLAVAGVTGGERSEADEPGDGRGEDRGGPSVHPPDRRRSHRPSGLTA